MSGQETDRVCCNKKTTIYNHYWLDLAAKKAGLQQTLEHTRE